MGRRDGWWGQGRDSSLLDCRVVYTHFWTTVLPSLETRAYWKSPGVGGRWLGKEPQARHERNTATRRMHFKFCAVWDLANFCNGLPIVIADGPKRHERNDSERNREARLRHRHAEIQHQLLARMARLDRRRHLPNSTDAQSIRQPGRGPADVVARVCRDSARSDTSQCHFPLRHA